MHEHINSDSSENLEPEDDDPEPGPVTKTTINEISKLIIEKTVKGSRGYVDRVAREEQFLESDNSLLSVSKYRPNDDLNRTYGVHQKQYIKVDISPIAGDEWSSVMIDYFVIDDSDGLRIEKHLPQETDDLSVISEPEAQKVLSCLKSARQIQKDKSSLQDNKKRT